VDRSPVGARVVWRTEGVPARQIAIPQGVLALGSNLQGSVAPGLGALTCRSGHMLCTGQAAQVFPHGQPFGTRADAIMCPLSKNGPMHHRRWGLVTFTASAVSLMKHAPSCTFADSPPTTTGPGPETGTGRRSE